MEPLWLGNGKWLPEGNGMEPLGNPLSEKPLASDATNRAIRKTFCIIAQADFK